MRPESRHTSGSKPANPKDTTVPAERQLRCRSKTRKRAEARYGSMAEGQYPAPGLDAFNSGGGPASAWGEGLGRAGLGGEAGLG